MTTPHESIRIGLYGTNGHQIQTALVDRPDGQLIAVADFAPDKLPQPFQNDPNLRRYETLDQLLADESVQLVSLCSPLRRRQAAEAIRCMQAGKHVYAEKPCAMTEPDLDAILDTVERTGMCFSEMANGIANEQPYLALRRTIEAGTIGQIVQVFTQKSYPYFDARPRDEDIDGGLLLQAGGHNLRMIEQVCGQLVSQVHAMETRLGNPHPGQLRMACNLSMRLAGGGLALGVVNYCNPPTFGTWGNEHLRAFGTRGMVEITDGGARTRLVTHQRDHGPLDLSEPSRDFLNDYLQAIRTGPTDRRQLEKQLHVTRMAIRAKQSLATAAN